MGWRVEIKLWGIAELWWDFIPTQKNQSGSTLIATIPSNELLPIRDAIDKSIEFLARK